MDNFGTRLLGQLGMSHNKVSFWVKRVFILCFIYLFIVGRSRCSHWLHHLIVMAAYAKRLLLVYEAY